MLWKLQTRTPQTKKMKTIKKVGAPSIVGKNMDTRWEDHHYTIMNMT